MFTHKELFARELMVVVPSFVPEIKVGQPAPNGKYRIGFLDHIHIVDGKIEKFSSY